MSRKELLLKIHSELNKIAEEKGQGTFNIPSTDGDDYNPNKHTAKFTKGGAPWNKGVRGYVVGKRTKPSPLLGKPRSEEDKGKISKGHLRRLGKEKPAENRDSRFSREWGIKVKKRDSYTCQGCGVQQKDLARVPNNYKTWLHAHHIKSWAKHLDLRFDVTNGITYCWECHLKAENKQIQVPDSMPLPVKRKRVAWNKGKKIDPSCTSYKKTEDQKIFNSLLQLLYKALGAITYKGGRPRGIPAHNKGKKLEEYVPSERLQEVRGKYAENARKNKPRLGTGKKKLVEVAA